MTEATIQSKIQPNAAFEMPYIDFRSDTVTWPTPAMREAMANAAVGDDVFGDDPTVQQLEAEAAERFGKEAGLFVASGTMGNVVALLAHCRRGDEVILGNVAHIFRSEVGSMSSLGGIHPHPIPVQPDGTLDLDDIRGAMRDHDNEHHPRTRLITIENTQANTGGNPLTAEYTAQVADLARVHDLKLHIDGARIFNAAAALNTPAKELAVGADSLTFCLSKGLCAPAGSVLVGSRDFIAQARRVRKSLGGGLRQVGVLAAAGLVALRDMTGRLHEDHEHARMLAVGLATVPCIHIDLEGVQTNFIFFDLDENAPLSPQGLSERLKSDYNILLNRYGSSGYRFRIRTHYWITREHIEQTVEALRNLLS